MVLVVAGLCFRVTAVPFHFYAPDVYQGTIQANAALLSVLPKAAGLLALVRLIVLGMPEMGPFAWKIFLVLSVLTMTLGNVLALWQENVRRLFAYSSIANAGYMLIGLAVGLVPGTGTSAGRWPVGRRRGHVLLPLRLRGGHARHVRGPGLSRPPAAAGRKRRGIGRFGPHPPRYGRRPGRLHAQPGRPAARRGTLGQAAALWQCLERRGGERRSLRPWFIALAIIGVLNAAVAAYYYLRIVSVMYFREPLATPGRKAAPAPISRRCFAA